MSLAILYPKTVGSGLRTLAARSIPDSVIVPQALGASFVQGFEFQAFDLKFSIEQGNLPGLDLDSPLDFISNEITISPTFTYEIPNGGGATRTFTFPGVGVPNSEGEYPFFSPNGEGLIENPDFETPGGGGGGIDLVCELRRQLFNVGPIPRRSGVTYQVSVGFDSGGYEPLIVQGTPPAPLAAGAFAAICSALNAFVPGLNGVLPASIEGTYTQDPLSFAYDLNVRVIGFGGINLGGIVNRFTVEPDAQTTCDIVVETPRVTFSRLGGSGGEGCDCESALRSIAGQVASLSNAVDGLDGRLADISDSVSDIAGAALRVVEIAESSVFGRTERGALDFQYLSAIRAASQTVSDSIYAAVRSVTGIAPKRTESSAAQLALVVPPSGDVGDFNPSVQVLPTVFGGAPPQVGDGGGAATTELPFRTSDVLEQSRAIDLSGFKQAAGIYADSIPSTPTTDSFEGFANQLGILVQTPEQLGFYRQLVRLFGGYAQASNAVNQDENLDNIEDRLGDVVELLSQMPLPEARAVALITVQSATENLREQLYERDSAIIRFGAVAFTDASGARGDVRYVTTTRCLVVSDIPNAAGIALFPQPGVSFDAQFLP